MDMPNDKTKSTPPPFGSNGLADLYELLDLLAIVFDAMATATSPYVLQSRMKTAASVFREKHGMEFPRADVFVARLRYNTGAAYGQRSRATTPLIQTGQSQNWDDSAPRTPRRKTGR